MTEPTDMEIESAWTEATGSSILPYPDDMLAFARVVLAKWGTPQPVVREPLTCEWTHNDDDGFWETACGEAWRFDDGGPAENSMHFCHSCGKSLCIKGGQHGTE